MRTERRSAAALAAVLWLGVGSFAASFVANEAEAQQPSDPDIAEARRLFDQGKKLEEDDKWGEALEAFRKVAQVKMTPQVLFHIALCEENLGHLAAALRDFEDAQSAATKEPETAKQVLENAPPHLEALRERTPRLRLEVESGARLRVILDGETLTPDRLGIDLPLDPGTHVIVTESTATGERVEREILLSEKARERIVLAPKKTEGAKKLDPIKPVAPKPAEPTSTTHGSKIPAITVGAVGVASLVGAGVFLGLRQSSISEVTGSCKDPVNLRGCNPALQPVADRGRTYTYVSASLAAVGAAGLVTGAVLWVTVGRDKPSQSATRVTVSPGMLSVSGRF